MTTAQAETPDSPPTKTIDIDDLLYAAEIVVFDTIGLPATYRCDRCGAQAYVEVEVWDAEKTASTALLFCVHHFTATNAVSGKTPEEILKETAKRIIDHRPFLMRQESAFKGLPTTP